MKVFIDANVLVAVLNKEYPAYSYASRVLSLSGRTGFSLYTSPVCLAIAFYFSEKKSGTAMARRKMQLLCDHIGITETGAYAVKESLANRRVLDLEDGIEYYSALKEGCRCIVTADIHDFHFSDLEVIEPRKFLEKYLS